MDYQTRSRRVESSPPSRTPAPHAEPAADAGEFGEELIRRLVSTRPLWAPPPDTGPGGEASRAAAGPGPGAATLVALQRLYGNQYTLRMLERRAAVQTGRPWIDRDLPAIDASRLSVPAFVREKIGRSPDCSAALADFRASHPQPERLSGGPLRQAGLMRLSALQTIRRMGRAPRETREDLETAPVTDEFVNDIFAFFYPGMQRPATIGDAERQLAAEMLWQAIQASRMMDMVPRPPAGAPGVAWLGLQAVQMAWRRGRDEGIYVAVRNTVAARYRSRYTLCVEGAGF